MIFCKSKKSAERILTNIIPFIEGKLYLKVNQDKTVVEQISKVKYLGYAFYRFKRKCRFRVHPISIKKMKDKIRAIYWKQWKKNKTKYKNLKKLGVDEEKAWICANMRNGNWYCGGYFVLQTAFNNKKLRELEYPTFTEFYLKICEN